MITPELKAQVQMAWHNWKNQLAGQYPSLTEEELLNLVMGLQSQYNQGLLPRGDFDRKMTEILKNPSSAVEVLHYQPAQRSTDSLIRELEALKRAKILNDEEFEERKAELLFQRNVKPEDATSTPTGDPEERRKRLMAHLDALLREGVLTQVEYDTARMRI